MGMNQAKYMRERDRAAYTKIDSYNSNPGTGAGGPYNHPHHPGMGYNNGSQSSKMKPNNLYDPGQLDSFSKYNLIPSNAEK